MSVRKLLLVVALVLGAGVVTAGIAVAAGGGSDDPPAVAEAPEPADDDGAKSGDEETEEADEDDTAVSPGVERQAADAALAATEGGEVLAVEGDDGGAGYEVEIRAVDGTEVEIELDEDFAVVQRAGD